MLTVFAFYTDDKLYTKHALALEKSAEKFNIKIHLEKVLKNDWQTIIAFKPVFIAKMRRNLEGPILYVDADAIFRTNIQHDFEIIKEDLAVHYFKDQELCSGTLFLNNTPQAYKLAELWEKRMLEQPERWDQKVLEDLVDELCFKSELTLKRLAPEYTFIYDSSVIEYPNLCPKIEHMQASRDFGWIKKYRSRSGVAKFFMRLPLFSKATRNLMIRHRAFNIRMDQMNINISLSLNDLI